METEKKLSLLIFRCYGAPLGSISRGSVSPSDGPSVGPSVRPLRLLFWEAGSGCSEVEFDYEILFDQAIINVRYAIRKAD